MISPETIAGLRDTLQSPGETNPPWRNRKTQQLLAILLSQRSNQPSELHISEDPVVYSPQEIKSLLLQRRLSLHWYKKLLSSVDLTKDLFLQLHVSYNAKFAEERFVIWCNQQHYLGILSRVKTIRGSIYGRDFSVTLVSRRSRHFAGTRYLKRGANDVETEQLVFDEEAGSKNDLSGADARINSTLLRYDPTYESTKMHFEDLVRRYGNPIIVLNLIKALNFHGNIHTFLLNVHAKIISNLSTGISTNLQRGRMLWICFLFSASRRMYWLFLGAVASEALDLTGFYFSCKPKIAKNKARHLSQVIFGMIWELSLRDLRAYSVELTRGESSNDILTALANREKEMKLSQQKIDDGTDSSVPLYQSFLRTNLIHLRSTPNSSIAAAALMDMYQSMGDALAQQFVVFPERQGKWKATTQSREFLKSIQRYYSNTYTDGEKQDAINLFLGYIQPQDGKPALWELDFDYYLHVVGIGDDIFPGSGVLSIPKPMSGIGVNLAPVPAFREDFSRKKPASFDKLIEQTCSSIKNVRLCSETDQRPGGSTGSTGVAPDAAEIQLKSPNWLFGSRKPEESGSATRPGADDSEKGVTSSERESTISATWNDHEEGIFQRYLSMTSTNVANGWYGGTLLGDQDENSEIYRHCAQFCQFHLFTVEPFDNDHDKPSEIVLQQSSAEVLHVNTVDVIIDIGEEETEMEKALNEYAQIGSKVGIIPTQCRYFAEDPCWLSRWLVGDDNIPKVI
ncbi:unnamed protein product [Brassica napus]|uniref:(rape) hypothetical protein n=1 Tax=Brassica napus TaxID=3708 RepID=A0A816L7Y1_BRANA|nr:unnamed protein product [Brassica napus]